MNAAFITKPTQDWEALFGTSKAPATAQSTTQEWLGDPSGRHHHTQRHRWQRDALGLSRQDIDALNPSANLVQLDALGGPKRDPKSDNLGYDDLAQAATGILVRFSGGMATPEEQTHAGTLDVLAGLTTCVALGAAILQKKKRTGTADIAHSSVTAAGNLLQA